MGGRASETERFLSGRLVNRERLAGHVLVMVAKLFHFVAHFVIVDGLIKYFNLHTLTYYIFVA